MNPDTTIHIGEVNIPELFQVSYQGSEYVATQDTSNYLLVCYDSISSQFSEVTTKERQSIFHLIREKGEPIAIPHQTQTGNGWIFGITVILLALMSLYLNSQRFNIREILQSIINKRVQERVFRENNMHVNTLIPMMILYFASLALTAFYALSHYDTFGLKGITLYGALLGLLLIFVLLKNGIVSLMGKVFESEESVHNYIVNNMLFYFIGGLVCPPLSLFLFYSQKMNHSLMNLVFVIAGIIFIGRLLKSLYSFLYKSEVTKLYLFYYLCIFEIVPILVIIKVLIS